MDVIWYKVWFDLWQRKGRTVLAILSIAAGVFAVGMIVGMGDQLLSTMDHFHLATNPSHFTINLTRPVAQDTAQALEDIPGVAGVESVNSVPVRYKTAADANWEAGLVVMRPDYTDQTYDYLSLKDGDWPEETNIGIERLTSAYFDLDIGDHVIFELEGTDRAFPITGKIRHPFVPPPDMGGSAYFFMDGEGLARLGVPRGYFNQISVRVKPYSEDYARDRAAALKERLVKQGHNVAYTVFQDPEEHWGRPFVEGANLVLQILAVMSLLTSVILVLNTTTAVITQQTDQIGVIKAIGGTSSVIIRVYLASVLVYGLLALLVALPLGVSSAFFTTQSLLNIFNIDYNTFHVSAKAITLQVLAAVLAPLLAALWPVWNGASISVRQAIASYGIGGDFGSSKIDQFVDRFGQKVLSTPYAASLSNVFRRKGRFLLTQGVLIAAGTMFLMVMTLAASLRLTLNNEMDRRAYDIRIRLTNMERADYLKTVTSRLSGVSEVETWFSAIGTVSKEGERVQDTNGLGGELTGIPAGSTMYKPRIVSGRWLRHNETGNTAVISQDMADFNNLSLGDVVTLDLGGLGESDWQIVGTYRTITINPISTDPIYAPASAVVQATKKANRATEVLVRAQHQRANETAQLLRALKEYYARLDIEIDSFFSRTNAQDREYAFNQFNIVINLLLSLAVVMGVVGGIGLMGSLSISVVERTREIGVLRAIGAKTLTMMAMFIMEGVVQGVISWLVALPLSFVVARPVARMLGQVMLEVDLDLAYNYTAVFIWLAIILIISILASLIPAYNASRISVRESLAYA